MASLSMDRISTLPENIIENILSRVPIQEALRTSILSKKWRYSWQGMPKLEFTDDMVKIPSDCDYAKLKKYKIVNAIFHVLLLHNGPTELFLHCSVVQYGMESEFAQIFSYLSRRNSVKSLWFPIYDFFYKLPISFFSLQGLNRLRLGYCTFQPPLTFNGFSRLKKLIFFNVKVSAEMLQPFLSKCPLIEKIRLDGIVGSIDYVEGRNKFTFVDLLQCVPLIRSLDISNSYMKVFSADGMPHKLPTSLVHLKRLFLEVCFMEQNEISSALCMIQSSPFLVKINFKMYGNGKLPVRQTPTNFLNPEEYSDLKLDHLETLEIDSFNNLPLEMEFVKLIMAKSPVLKKLQIKLHHELSVDEEMKMLRDLVRLPLPRASPSAELVFERRYTSI